MKPRRVDGRLQAGDLGRLQHEVGNLFNLLSPSRQSWPSPLWRETRIFPRVNVQESREAYVVRCEIPGVAMKDLEIRLEGDTLVLKGMRNPDTVDEDASFHRRERAVGEFRRCVALSEAVDHQRVQASYRNGVLTVTLTKRERMLPRKIQIVSD